MRWALACLLLTFFVCSLAVMQWLSALPFPKMANVYVMKQGAMNTYDIEADERELLLKMNREGTLIWAGSRPDGTYTNSFRWRNCLIHVDAQRVIGGRKFVDVHVTRRSLWEMLVERFRPKMTGC